MNTAGISTTRLDEQAALAAPPPPEPPPVELATLALPSAAVGTGLEAGQQQQVVLVACNSTVEKIRRQQPKAATDANNNQDNQCSHISAVVDLDKLGELVRANRGAGFIAGLHGDAHGKVEAMTTNKQQEEADEETPLVENSYDSTIGDNTTSITLSADPFIKCMANVLPQEGQQQVHAANTTATSYSLDGAHHQHCLTNDAFLLHVPTMDAQGGYNGEHHCVLALPKIAPEQKNDNSNNKEEDDGDGDPPPDDFFDRAASVFPSTTQLPTDIESVHLNVTTTTQPTMTPSTSNGPSTAAPSGDSSSHVQLGITVQRRVPLVGCLILVAAVLGLSSVGAALDLQRGAVTPTVKTLWRQVATAMVLLPLAFKSLWFDYQQTKQLLPCLSPLQCFLLLFSAVAYTGMNLLFAVALDLTTLANTFVLGNLPSILIVVGRVSLGLPVLPAEGVGALTGFVGAALCADDASRSLMTTTDENDGGWLPFLGNVSAFSASCCTAAYLLIGKRLRSQLDLFVFMFAIMTFGSMFLLLVIYLSGKPVSWDRHIDHGIFGWWHLQADRFPLEIYIAVVCNLIGTTGYVAAMKYFDPVVPATAMLLEPAVGALMGYIAGTSTLPGVQTWIGDVVVATGTFLVVWAGSRKTESIDATEAIRSPPPGENRRRQNNNVATWQNPIHVLNPISTLSARRRKAGAKVVWQTE